MHNVSLTSINEALFRIRPIVRPSPIKESFFLRKRVGQPCFLKLENLNLAGSFKIRGACNAILQMNKAELAQGIVAASAGNHAQGIAYACRAVGASATIFMPERTPLVKADSTRELGAQVHLTGANLEEAYRAAMQFQNANNGQFVHPFSDARVISGQGTAGLELLDQLEELSLVLVPIGGGGLASGMACAIKEKRPEVKVIGVQTQAYPAAQLSFHQGTPCQAVQGHTIADGIAVKGPSDLTLGLMRQYLDDVIVVDEESISAAIMDLMERDHTLAEGAGAVSVAALSSLSPELLSSVRHGAIACVISGGNIDVNLLSRIIPNGMKASWRHLRIRALIPDRPGRLADLLNTIGKVGANLLDVRHNRLIGAHSLEDVEVDMDLETIDKSHQEQIFAALAAAKVRYKQLA